MDKQSEQTKSENLKSLIHEKVVIDIGNFDYWLIYVTEEEVCLKSTLDGKLTIHNIKQTRFFKKSDEIL